MMKSENYLDHFSNNLENYKVTFKTEMHLLAMSSIDIVEAFDISDNELLSVVGKKSYKDSEEMYQNMMDVVRKNPLNQQPIAKGFNRYIRPILDGKL
mmetsp:Transcript_51522/g.70761  ORF Transcript_51522/g.70761 Transcript_51522/m.70761 type:complete len:97 (+) Transcript_51522:187-477(+)